MSAADLADKMDKDQAGFWEQFVINKKDGTGDLVGFKLMNVNGKALTILFLLDEKRRTWQQFTPEELKSMLQEENGGATQDSEEQPETTERQLDNQPKEDSTGV